MIEPGLMAHQHEGLEFLLRAKAGLLAFEQGLGKTLIAIRAFQELLKQREAERMIVVCPNSLKRNWVQELEKWAPGLTNQIVEGAARPRRVAINGTKATVLIVNYEAARNEIAPICGVMRRSRCLLVLDESHSVKNLRSLNAVAAHHFSPLAEYRWLLSGTPVTNKPLDIYSQIDVIDPHHALGSPELFELKFADADHSETRRKQLNATLSKYVLRRTKAECLNLPEKLFADTVVALPPWQQALYDEVREGLVAEVRGLNESANRRFANGAALTRLLRLSQVATNPALVFPQETRVPAKFAELDSLLAKITPTEKVILWSSYVQTIKALAGRYQQYGAVTLYGEVPPESRQEIANAFQTVSGTRLLIANPAAAGTGFTLTAATVAIYESLSWRYDLFAQSQDRNHRIGQTREVKYIRLIAAETIEDKLISSLKRKDEMAQAFSPAE